MEQSKPDEPQAAVKPRAALPSGGGEMGERIRAFDWAASPLGCPEHWPRSLHTALGILLNSGYPMYIAWGPAFIQFYNDAYRPILGSSKHPDALGRTTQETFAEIWDFIGPMFRSVLQTSRASTFTDQILPLDRNGFPEECYFTFSYSAILDQGDTVGGVFVTVIETTERVLRERRLAALRALAQEPARDSITQLCHAAAAALRGNQTDAPFAALYEHQADGGMERVECFGIDPDGLSIPPRFDDTGPAPWFVGAPVATTETRTQPPVEVVLLPRAIAPPNGWAGTLPVTHAVRAMIMAPGQSHASAFMLVGLSPHLRLDDAYLDYFRSAATLFGNLIAEAQAYLVERRRAEALAEIDRAKTVFFSNVSHEFRTPLTLMLGPLEELLSNPAGDLSPGHLAQLAGVRRNGRRLLKLVNVLLDFARIEAGRSSAHYVPTDLARMTADLAGHFRAACERAGVALRVDCPPLSEMAYVDHGMWEKILFNLLSNAFKFTFEGEIAVRLGSQGDHFVLSVRDTGVGIPAHALTRVFERFHRVEGAQGRSHEGSGIGLALVQELVKLHGGTIDVDSLTGRGSEFRVSIPKGHAHLPADQVDEQLAVDPPSGCGDLYVDEAWGWVPSPGGVGLRHPPVARDLPYVLLADDNADMRDYVGRLLSDSYEVLCVSDGLQALEAARRRRPDLILSDVMMPGLDGIGLVHALRNDASLRMVPTILLSARAGEDERHKGLEQGADDYLVKPFSSRELLVRVASLLRSVDIRREANRALALHEEKLRITLEAANLGAWELDGIDGPFTGDATCMGHLGLPGTPEPGPDAARGWQTHLGPHDRERLVALMRVSLRDLVPFDTECRVDAPHGVVRRIAMRGRPVFDARRQVQQLIGVTIDVTERRRSDEALHQNEQRLRATLTATGTGHWDVDLRDPARGEVSPQLARIFGYPTTPVQWSHDVFLHHVDPDDRDRVNGIWRMAVAGQREHEFECRIVRADGMSRWIWVGASVSQRDDEGRPVRLSGLVRDITERHETEAALRDARARLDATLAAAELGSWTWDIAQDRVVADGNLMRLFDVSESDVAGGPLARYLRAIHPDDLSEAQDRLAEAVRSGEPLEATYRVCRSDGSIRYLIARGRAEFGPDGQASRLSGIVLDVTEQKLAEAALRDSEAYLRQVIDASAEGFYGIDTDGKATLCNAGFLRMLGFSCMEEVVGRELHAVIHHSRADGSPYPAHDCPIHRAATTGVPGHADDEWFFRRDGSSFPVEYWTYPVVIDGRLRGAVTTFIDITQRKLASASLRRSEEAARSARQTLEITLAASATGTFRFDLRTQQFVEFDATMRKLFAVHEHADVRTVEQFLAAVHPQDVPLVASAMAGAIRDAVDFELEFRVATGDADGERWIFDRAKVVRDSTEQRRFLVGACTDVTWRRRSEEAARVAAAENARLVESLRQADQRKDVFLATLSHELRNPLAPLRNALTLLAKPDVSEDRMRHLLALMTRQVDHLVRLVDDLMEISRINRGAFELRMERVDVAGIMRAAVEASDHLMQQARHRLRVELPRQPLAIRGDPVRLIQVLGNLLNNAAKYTPPGGTISLRARRQDAWVRFSVVDNGSGMTAESLAQIFDMFSRGDRMHLPQQDGLGIGLALARRLAQMHGGVLEARSDGPGRGSEFILQLPLHPAGDVDIAGQGWMPPADLCRLDVLVVDDNRDAVDTLAEVLRMRGASARVAYSGLQAIELFTVRAPDAVLLDIGMPDMDGYAVARRLRALQQTEPRTCIVALTGWGQEHDRRRSQDAGFDHHLVKPVDIGVVVRLLAGLSRNTTVGAGPADPRAGTPAGGDAIA